MKERCQQARHSRTKKCGYEYTGSFGALPLSHDGGCICHDGKDTLSRHAERSEASRKKTVSNGDLQMILPPWTHVFAGSFGALPLWMTAFGYATEAKTLSLVIRSEAKHPEKQSGKEMIF